ncbi:tyrosine-type recombinase/integrase [Croceicoccus naphthovorans]|uniref:Integrase n=1 Tax=Croceicoccus naphthovorans TaxID=1348774 RepID=A0A0G3XNI6_9SPHN|nr:tyrosine-type recombinase/integrase [Croceicoccus naphthovorans]AKM12171.1 integrase [Croceicoccus naphthovorans]MBB3990982.1 site-specific recombinase XerD [Croceicoccus naphthovorans]
MAPETALDDDRPDRGEALSLSRDLALVAHGPGAGPSPELLAAYVRAAAPNTLRAFRSDVLAFDAWCRSRGEKSIPASPQIVADWLSTRASGGAAPASLSRYKASIARLHRLCGLADPTGDELVRLTLAAYRREKGVAQKQARALRFRGAVKDPLSDTPRGINVRAVLASLGDGLTDLRDKALLSLAYDTGLRASELVAVQVEDIGEAIDADARLLAIPRSKGDQEGEGATAYLSPRTVRALEAWLKAAVIGEGPVFRRVVVRRYAARQARKARNGKERGWNARWVPERFAAKDAEPVRIESDVGEGALHPGSITPLIRSMLRRAFDVGAFGDLDAATFEKQVREISAHSTRVGVNQDYFAAGEDLAGIMDALRWKSPRMPLQYNRNLAAEQGAAGRLLGKLR